jgi:hypothetical protein
MKILFFVRMLSGMIIIATFLQNFVKEEVYNRKSKKCHHHQALWEFLIVKISTI